MFRRLSSLLIALSTMLLVLFTAGAMAHAQSSTAPGRVDPIKRPNNRAASTLETSTAKGWDGKVQGRALVTPVVLTFDSPNDYANFAAGKLPLNLVLVNTLSRQTTILDSKVLSEISRVTPTTRGTTKLTIDVMIDNMSAPLSDAACGEIKLSAEKAADGSGMNITLNYSACGSATVSGGAVAGVVIAATSDNNRMATAGNGGKGPGENGRWLIISGEKNSGNVNVMLGDSRVVARETAGNSVGASAVILVRSSNGKGSGSPKQAGF